MNSDPWLTDDGEPHPAAEWGGMPEWEEEGVGRFHVQFGAGCWMKYWFTRGGWMPWRPLDAHEAAALLEKHLREKLAERGIDVRFDGERWFVWGPQGYLNDIGEWDAEAMHPVYFDTYTAAIQAACMAAKENDDGKGSTHKASSKHRPTAQS